jgi:hypothetical protein
MEQSKFVAEAWKCSCGALNSRARTECGNCGKPKEK